MIDKLNSCTICPNNCNINRNNGKTGFCKVSNNIKVALYSLHFWEEPCISGTNGSRNSFFL